LKVHYESLGTFCLKKCGKYGNDSVTVFIACCMTGEEILQAFLFHGITPVSEKKNGKPIVLFKGKWSDQFIALMKEQGARFDNTWKCWYMVRSRQKLIVLLRVMSRLSGYQLPGERECSEMERMILLKGYSNATVKNYTYAFQQFRDYFAGKNLQTLTVKEIEDYLLHLRVAGNKSETVIHTSVNAIKFYYEQVLGLSKQHYTFIRPKKPMQLPSVFSVSEVERIINSIDNLKHKSMIMIAYAGGLRVSEIVALKPVDIDSARMVIHIRRGKGKKDRDVMLSEVLLEVLRAYYIAYQPKVYLFEGQQGGAYSTRSLNQIVAEAKKKAGIQKRGSIHIFRHSFATHLMETGIAMNMIQKLLGHADIKTTLRYTHVSKQTLLNIKSPLDQLSFQEDKKTK
jgi:site-specific recombinase XerD